MMINIRKIVLLSALLMSASSLVAPTYAMNDDEQGSAPRVTHAQRPNELTQDVISEIREHGSFLAAAKEYVLQNPEQLDFFASYLPAYQAYQYSPYFQGSYMNYNELYYFVQEGGFSRYPNPNYDPARPEETGPEWIEEGHTIELSRLTFKEQDPAPAKPLAVAPKVEQQDPAPEKPLAVASKVEEQEDGSGAASSVQAPVSSDSSSEDAVKAMIIRSLTETYRSDPVALGKAMAVFLTNLK